MSVVRRFWPQRLRNLGVSAQLSQTLTPNSNSGSMHNNTGHMLHIGETKHHPHYCMAKSLSTLQRHPSHIPPELDYKELLSPNNDKVVVNEETLQEYFENFIATKYPERPTAAAPFFSFPSFEAEYIQSDAPTSTTSEVENLTSDHSSDSDSSKGITLNEYLLNPMVVNYKVCDMSSFHDLVRSSYKAMDQNLIESPSGFKESSILYDIIPIMQEEGKEAKKLSNFLSYVLNPIIRVLKVFDKISLTKCSQIPLEFEVANARSTHFRPYIMLKDKNGNITPIEVKDNLPPAHLIMDHKVDLTSTNGIGQLLTYMAFCSSDFGILTSYNTTIYVWFSKQNLEAKEGYHDVDVSIEVFAVDNMSSGLTLRGSLYSILGNHHAQLATNDQLQNKKLPNILDLKGRLMKSDLQIREAMNKLKSDYFQSYNGQKLILSTDFHSEDVKVIRSGLNEKNQALVISKEEFKKLRVINQDGDSGENDISRKITETQASHLLIQILDPVILEGFDTLEENVIWCEDRYERKLSLYKNLKKLDGLKKINQPNMVLNGFILIEDKKEGNLITGHFLAYEYYEDLQEIYDKRELLDLAKEELGKLKQERLVLNKEGEFKSYQILLDKDKNVCLLDPEHIYFDEVSQSLERQDDIQSLEIAVNNRIPIL